jgi:hypothetical protein
VVLFVLNNVYEKICGFFSNLFSMEGHFFVK